MAAKKQTIALRKAPLDETYSVIRVSNSTDYSPGETLSKSVVNTLCKAPRWQVDIVGQ